MIMHDYNKEAKKVVLLLHPMLANGAMMYELLGKHLGDVRCLAPDFASHGEEIEHEFISAAKEADAIVKYLKDNQIEKIDLAFGASLGGVVLTELIKRGLKFDKAFFEGTSFFRGNKLLTKIVASKFIKKHQRAVADYNRALTAMGQLYGEAYAVDFAKQFIAMSENSINNIAIACGDNKSANLDEAKQAACTFAYGSKDPNLIVAKKRVHKYYPKAKLVLWEGYDHCEKIVADTAEYIKMLKTYMN